MPHLDTLSISDELEKLSNNAKAGREWSIIGSFALSPNCCPHANTESAANMPIRAPLPVSVFTRRMPLRWASTSAKPLPKYTGRIPKPAPPPPGPGELQTPDSNKETAQARKAFKDVIQEDKQKDYKRRYNSAFWHWMRFICAAPIALVTAPYLFNRGATIIHYYSSKTTLTFISSLLRRRTKEAREGGRR